MAKEISCPICLELSNVWVDSDEYWCPVCEEVFPIHINSPEWRDWYQKKFGQAL